MTKPKNARNGKKAPKDLQTNTGAIIYDQLISVQTGVSPDPPPSNDGTGISVESNVSTGGSKSDPASLDPSSDEYAQSDDDSVSEYDPAKDGSSLYSQLMSAVTGLPCNNTSNTGPPDEDQSNPGDNVEDLKARIAQLETLLNESVAKSQKLHTLSSETLDTTDKYKEKAAVLKKSLGESEAKNKELSEKLRESEANNKELSEKLRESEAKNKKLEADNTHFKNKEAQNERLFKDTLTYIENINAQNKQLKQENSSLRSQVQPSSHRRAECGKPPEDFMTAIDNAIAELEKRKPPPPSDC
jgi:hypothetical protein